MNVNEVPIVLLMEICITQLEVYYNHLTHPTIICPWSFIAFLGDSDTDLIGHLMPNGIRKRETLREVSQ